MTSKWRRIGVNAKSSRRNFDVMCLLNWDNIAVPTAYKLRTFIVGRGGDNPRSPDSGMNPDYAYHKIAQIIPCLSKIELLWLQQLWNDEDMFETGAVRANDC